MGSQGQRWDPHQSLCRARTCPLLFPHQELISGHFGEDGASYETEIRELTNLRQVGGPHPAPPWRPPGPNQESGHTHFTDEAQSVAEKWSSV